MWKQHGTKSNQAHKQSGLKPNLSHESFFESLPWVWFATEPVTSMTRVQHELQKTGIFMTWVRVVWLAATSLSTNTNNPSTVSWIFFRLSHWKSFTDKNNIMRTERSIQSDPKRCLTCILTAQSYAYLLRRVQETYSQVNVNCIELQPHSLIVSPARFSLQVSCGGACGTWSGSLQEVQEVSYVPLPLHRAFYALWVSLDQIDRRTRGGVSEKIRDRMQHVWLSPDPLSLPHHTWFLLSPPHALLFPVSASSHHAGSPVTWIITPSAALSLTLQRW